MRMKMTTEVIINADQTVSVKWTGTTGGESLFYISAVGMAELLNRMSLDSILLALIASKVTPFPLGDQQAVLDRIEKAGGVVKFFPLGCAFRQRSFGDLRRAIVHECGDSYGGPLDGWITWISNNLEHK